VISELGKLKRKFYKGALNPKDKRIQNKDAALAQKNLKARLIGKHFWCDVSECLVNE
jgi:hypothetical protein